MTISFHDPRRPPPWLAKKLGIGRDEPGDLDLSKDTTHGDVQLNPFAPNFNANPFANNNGQSGAAPVNYGDYQYGNNPGDTNANNLANTYGMESSQERGQANMGQEQLGNFYQGQLSGTGPSLAALQAKQSTDQTLQAQQAAAASAKGSLGAAGAQEQAGMGAAAAEQAGAQAAVQGRVGEEYNAASGLQGLAGQEQQAGLGWAGAQQGVYQGEEQAKEAQGNYELGQGAQAQQGSEYGSSMFSNAIGAIAGGAGSAASSPGGASAADADLIEPGGGAGETLREERATKGHPGWVLMVDHQTGEMSKVATEPLTPEEHAQARGEHGAGPLNSPHRDHTNFNDLAMSGTVAGSGGGWSGPAAYSGPGPAGIQPRATTLGPRGRVAAFNDAPGSLAGALSGPAPTPLAYPGASYNPSLASAPLGSQLGLGAAPAPTQWSPSLVSQPLGGGTLAPDQKPWGDVASGPSLAEDRLSPEARAKVGPDPTQSAAFATKTKPGAAGGGFNINALGGPGASGGGGAPASAWVDTRSPEGLKKIRQGEAEEQAANTDAQAADQQALEDAGVLAMRKGQQLGEDKAQIEADANKDRDAVQSLLDKRDTISKNVQNLGEHYGFHPTTATRVRYGIASFLGAFGAAMAHTQNFAQQQIEANINRDLDAQQKQIEAGKGRLADIDSTLAETYRATGHMDTAKALARSIGLQKFDQEAAQDAARNGSAASAANYQKLHGVLLQKIGEADDAATKHVVAAVGNPGADLRAKIIKRGQELVNSGKFDNVVDAQRFAAGELGVADATDLQAAGKAGAGVKPNVPSAALGESVAGIPKGAGLDWWNRNAPDALQSSSKLAERAQLADLAREYIKAGGGRPPPAGKEGDEAAIQSTIGRPTPEAVEAFRKRAAKRAEATKNAGQGAPDLGEP